MAMQQPLHRTTRLGAFTIVLVLHGLPLYSLWHSPVAPPAAAATTVFVSLWQELPQTVPARQAAEPPQPDRQHVPPAPPPLAAAAPATRPDQARLPRQPEPKRQRHEVVNPAPPAAPPPPSAAAKTAIVSAQPPALPVASEPVLLDTELAVTCPGRSAPTYPARSLRLGEQGKVVLRVELDESGRVASVSIRESSGYPRLDEAALTAVQHWHCRPARHNGVTVRAIALQPLNFVLEGR
jgi:protein TonB